MPATVQDLEGDLVVPEPAMSWRDAQQEDAFWRRSFWQERYWRPDLDYEDYAPAYCVGYIGFAQYGGDFHDAEPSLRANWERIKSDSRLSLEEAMPPIKAAWDRAARLRARWNAAPANEAVFEETPLHQQRGAPALALSPTAAVA